ncbi:MAG TPA: FtsX-like permease family protein [Ruminiclostridium sp.]|nr:FtsX-like permease family protein [Ruminiclostridium sp.]
MKNYSTLTSRYLKKHRGRTILTLVGIIIAIAMFTAIGSIYYSGIHSEIEDAKKNGDYEVSFNDMGKDKVNILSANAEFANGGAVKLEGTFKFDNDKLTESLRTLDIKSYDAAAFTDIFKIKLVEGRLPKSSSEIVIDKKLSAVMKDKKISNVLKGTLTGRESSAAKEYTIVGTYDSNNISNTALSYLDIKTSTDSKDYIFYANMKSNKNIVSNAQKIAKANNIKFDTNTYLLYLMGEGPDARRNDSMGLIFGIIAGFVVICTVVVIYNAFNISVMERIKHFGILRSIGATKAQIRRLVLKEAAIMSAISVPIGILSGFAGIFITFRLVMNGFLGAFEIGFYPQVVIMAALLGIFTVFISAFFPARTASKVSPIDAIRGTVVVKGDKVKRRGGRWAKLLFNFEGQVAYKNIKRNRKRFYITCISLMISLVMFVFFSNFIDIFLQSNKIANQTIKVEAYFAGRGTDLSASLSKHVKGMDGIKEVYEMSNKYAPYTLDKKMLSDKFITSLKKRTKLDEYGENYIINNVNFIGYDKSCLNLFNKENKTNIDYDSFVKNNEVIIVNKARGMGEKSSFYSGFTQYKAGDEIKLPVLNTGYLKKPDTKQLKHLVDNGKAMTFKVIGVVDYETVIQNIPINSFGMIMSNETFKRLTGSEQPSIIAMNFNSPEYAEKNYESLNILADENKASYTDIYKMKEQSDKQINQIMILIYGFISLIILISTVNIINTVTINLLVKKREYATFKAIGMTRGQFQKLVLLEGTLFGIIACIIGLPIAFLLTYYGVLHNNPVGDIGYKAALWPYIYGGLGIVAITLLAALFPLRKLNDMNIVESLRLEE